MRAEESPEERALRLEVEQEKEKRVATVTQQAVKRMGLDIDEGSDKSVAEQLRDALSKHAIKVMDLFRNGTKTATGT